MCEMIFIRLYSNPKSVMRKTRGVWGLRPQEGATPPPPPTHKSSGMAIY
jgi:hypothetical protein